MVQHGRTCEAKMVQHVRTFEQNNGATRKDIPTKIMAQNVLIFEEKHAKRKDIPKS